MNKKSYFKLLLCVVVAGLTACSSNLKPLVSSYIKADPQPLELVAGKVPVTINATFPPKWFNKKATVTVIPVLRYEGGEAWGNSYVYQGEKVAGNGQVIPQKEGANVTMKSTFNYVPQMLSSELYLTFTAKIGNKEIELPDVKIGEGVLATADLLNAASETPAIAPDKFQRIIKEAYDENIMFLIQQAEIRSGELKKESLSNWKNVVENASLTPNQNVDIEISSYASPDGGYELNEKLAEKREGNTKKYLSKELKKANVDAPINARYTAQDWEGFKELVEKSNIQDKELILRVLAMNKDSESREREIKNISSVFSELAEEILPQLRRSRLTANIEIIGKSDEEITELANNNPKMLTVEELLYAATLTDSASEKEAIYKQVVNLYPNDSRGYNNLGATEFAKGNIAEAANNFSKANQLAGNLPEANLNLGLVALAQNDSYTAQQYFGNAAGVEELNNAMGLLAVQNGNYQQAVQAFGNTASNNAGLAQLMTKDYNKAQNTLNAVANPDATTYYLKAVVGARTNNLDGVTSNLQKAISLDSSCATKAMKDCEFAKYLTNTSFLQAVAK